MQYGLGLIPDKRKNILTDYVLTSPLTEDVQVADRQNYRSLMSPNRNQGQEGSCGGQAMGAGVGEFLQGQDYGKLILLSTRWIYNLSRDKGGYKEGCTLSDLCWVAQHVGIPEEQYWPYIAGDKTTKPLPGVEENAKKYRIKSYARVPDLKRLLIAMNDPLVRVVLIGVNVYKGMIEPPCTETGIVPDPTCFQRPLGGHAMVVDAYDMKEQLSQYKKPGWIEAKNSWSTKYGDKGYNKFSTVFITKNMKGAYACTDIPKEELEKKTVKVADIETCDIKSERLWIPVV